MIDTIILDTPRCVFCGEKGTLKVSAEGYHKWLEGDNIYDAIPELGPDEREQLFSGIHPECNYLMYPDEP